MTQCGIDQTACYDVCDGCVDQCWDDWDTCRAAIPKIPNNVCAHNRNDCRNACPAVNACRVVCDTTYATCTVGGGGGGNNFWLPWPALTNLSGNIEDYKVDAFYNDNDAVVNPPPEPMGRFPETIDDSNAATGNSSVDMFANCSAITPVINPSPVDIDFTNNNDEYKVLWRHWKDHLFYIIGSGFEQSNEDATATPDCTTTPAACVEVINGGVSDYYAAVVIYSGTATVDQRRDLDKGDYTNYLESYDAVNNRFSFTSGQNSDDIAYCISHTRVISKCSP